MVDDINKDALDTIVEDQCLEGSIPEINAKDELDDNAGQINAELDLIKASLKEAVEKQEEYLNMAQRVQADFDNFRKRNASVRKEAFDSGAAEFAKSLIPVIDNFERALAVDVNDGNSALIVGVNMVHRQLIEAFEKRGILQISRLGEVFDPTLEEAVAQGSIEDGVPGTVCEVLQKGYIMDKAVIRFSMVKVVPEQA